MENELRRVVDAIPGFVWSAAPDGSVDFLNQRWCDYTGVSLEDARGSGWQTAIHPDDVARVIDYWRSLLESGQPGEFEARLRRVDGAFRWFLIRAVPLREETGTILQWYGQNIDIEELKQSEARKTAILGSALDCIITIDHEGLITEFNPAAERTFGYRRDEVVGKELAHVIIPPSLREQHRRGFARYLTTGNARVLGKRVELTAVRADGSEFPVELAITRITLDGPPSFTGYLRDITERNRAIEKLQANQELLDLAQRSAGAMAFDWHVQKGINYWSPEQEGLFGLAPGSFDGTYKSWKKMMYAPDWPIVVDAIKHAQQTGEVTAEYRVVWPDGSLHWLLTKGRMFFDSEGKPLRMVGFTSDVTPRKLVEEELRRSAEFLAEAQRLTSIGSFTWLAATDELAWSEELYRIFEFDRQKQVTLEMIGTRVHPEDMPLFKDHLARARVDGSFVDFEFRLQMANRSVKYMHVVAHSGRNENGQMEYIGAVQDVTERRLSEEVLSEVRSELAHMTRVTSLGALTASIAHEVNQPLSGIITNAGTCLRMLDADPPNVDGARQTAQRTIRDGQRASDVITRLRALFSKRDATTESVDLNEAIREVIALSRSELQRSQVISRVELADDLPPVTGDRVQLQQVVLNLLLNAADAMSGIDDRPRQLIVRTERDESNHVRLSVQDGGVGFGSQGLDKLFEPFYTTKSGGMGIGLAVSRSIIESHHGRLWATPNVGPGATFSFSIPCAAAEYLCQTNTKVL
jgi:PAS domain S-box-containing protein